MKTNFAWRALMNKKLFGWLAAPALCLVASVANAGVTSVDSVVVPQSTVAGFTTNDVVIDFSGILRGQQMILELTAGSIFQQAAFGTETAPNGGLIPVFPDVAYDTFVTVGGRTLAESQAVLVVGGAVDLQPGAAKKFDTQGLNIAWAPGTGVDVDGGTDYITSRITLSNDAQGTFKYFGSTSAGSGDPLVVDGSVVDGSIVFGGPPVLPVVGDLAGLDDSVSRMITGVVPVENVDSLVFDAVGAPTFTPLIPGKPLVLNSPPTIDAAGNFSWDATGALRGTYSWALTGSNADGSDPGSVSVTITTVPEPATFALVGLALVGFAGCCRRK
jgi:hypothetical protein